MKVLILGGTGVFGERLARLLARDDHQIALADNADFRAGSRPQPRIRQ